jgi:PAS domain S-box-containing protein
MTSGSTSRPDLDPVHILDAVRAIAVSVADTGDAQGVAGVVARSARALLGADDVVVYLWDPDAGVLRLTFDDNSGLELREVLAPGEAAIGRAFVSGEPEVVHDYQHWTGALSELVEAGVKRAAAVPLRLAERTIGVLAVRFVDPGVCAPEHIQALQLLATPIAALLDVAVARQRAQVEQARLATILEFLPCGVLVLDGAGRIILLNEHGRRLGTTGADHRGIRLRDIEGLELFEPVSGRKLSPDQTPTARALRGEVVFKLEVRVRRPDSNEDLRMQVSAVPLYHDQELNGAVAVFTDITRERQLLSDLQSSVRENDRLLGELQHAQSRHHDLLGSLHQTDAQIASAQLAKALSKREREVLERLSRGETNRQIGLALGLSAGTVKKHVEHILKKLAVADRTQAAVRASELGLAIRTD